jgi:hypothetical protein
VRGPIEITERVWWVGRYTPGDPFQCHAYLIERGDESVPLDPGGPMIFDHVLEKVEAVVGFDRVRWFVCHHQDPDITASLPRIDSMVTRPDAAVIVHRPHASRRCPPPRRCRRTSSPPPDGRSQPEVGRAEAPARGFERCGRDPDAAATDQE